MPIIAINTKKTDWQPLTRWQNKWFSTKPTSSRCKLHISNYTFQNSHIHLNSNLKFFFIAINRNSPNQKKLEETKVLYIYLSTYLFYFYYFFQINWKRVVFFLEMATLTSRFILSYLQLSFQHLFVFFVFFIYFLYFLFLYWIINICLYNGLYYILYLIVIKGELNNY